MSATTVNPLTPYTCALACLESYFSDVNRPFSQTEMLKQFYPILQNPNPDRKHEYGSTNEAKIIGLCSVLGFSAVLYMDFRQHEVEMAFKDALAKNHGVLIMMLWKKQDNHCVRLSQIKSSGLYEVMCPYFYPPSSALEDVTFTDLSSWGFRFLIIS